MISGMVHMVACWEALCYVEAAYGLRMEEGEVKWHFTSCRELLGHSYRTSGSGVATVGLF